MSPRTISLPCPAAPGSKPVRSPRQRPLLTTAGRLVPGLTTDKLPPPRTHRQQSTSIRPSTNHTGSLSSTHSPHTPCNVCTEQLRPSGHTRRDHVRCARGAKTGSRRVHVRCIFIFAAPLPCFSSATHAAAGSKGDRRVIRTSGGPLSPPSTDARLHSSLTRGLVFKLWFPAVSGRDATRTHARNRTWDMSHHCSLPRSYMTLAHGAEESQSWR